MHILVLGKGKTGSLVADVARERGHQVEALDVNENLNGAGLTAARLADVDAVIDFTAPEAAIANITAVLTAGSRIVVGTTGWYAQLDAMRALATAHKGALLYGTNFSMGVLKLFQLTAALAQLEGYTFSIDETHHESKVDAPSGTAMTLQQIVEAGHTGVSVEVTSHRVGDAKGEHIVTATGPDDVIEIRHDALSRRGFAVGAVRAAEWLAGKEGAFDFREIFEQL